MPEDPKTLPDFSSLKSIPDLYTKAMLTIIAACLFVLVVRDIVGVRQVVVSAHVSGNVDVENRYRVLRVVVVKD